MLKSASVGVHIGFLRDCILCSLNSVTNQKKKIEEKIIFDSSIATKFDNCTEVRNIESGSQNSYIAAGSDAAAAQFQTEPRKSYRWTS